MTIYYYEKCGHKVDDDDGHEGTEVVDDYCCSACEKAAREAEERRNRLEVIEEKQGY